MSLDYNKKTFTEEEKEILLTESTSLRNEYPDKIPILVQISSDVITVEKSKFLVSENSNVEYLFEVLKKKISGLTESDTLIISVTTLTGPNGKKLLTLPTNLNVPLKEFYIQHMDPETNMLIFTVSRHTTFKFVKSVAKWAFKMISPF